MLTHRHAPSNVNGSFHVIRNRSGEFFKFVSLKQKLNRLFKRHSIPYQFQEMNMPVRKISRPEDVPKLTSKAKRIAIVLIAFIIVVLLLDWHLTADSVHHSQSQSFENKDPNSALPAGVDLNDISFDNRRTSDS